MKHKLQWFIDRIGKRIYRKPSTTCGCKECQRDYVDICELGIDGKTHAHYIYDCQNDLNINYSDKPV